MINSLEPHCQPETQEIAAAVACAATTSSSSASPLSPDSAAPMIPEEEEPLAEEVVACVQPSEGVAAVPVVSEEKVVSAVQEEESVEPVAMSATVAPVVSEEKVVEAVQEEVSVGPISTEQVGVEQVGKSVRRHFEGHGWFVGVVTKFRLVSDKDDVDGAEAEAAEATSEDAAVAAGLWTVAYPDGDSEDLSLEEMTEGLRSAAEASSASASSSEENEEVGASSASAAELQTLQLSGGLAGGGKAGGGTPSAGGLPSPNRR